MKKIIFTLFALITLSAFGQSDYQCKLYFLKVDRDTVRQGDSVTIYYSMENAQFHPEIQTVIYFVGDWFNHQSFDYTWAVLHSDTSAGYSSKHDYPINTNYSNSIRVKVPDNAKLGAGMFESNNYPRALREIYILEKQTATLVQNSRSGGKILKSEYYDLFGRQITEPQHREIYVRVDYYSDGSFKSSRIFNSGLNP